MLLSDELQWHSEYQTHSPRSPTEVLEHLAGTPTSPLPTQITIGTSILQKFRHFTHKGVR